MANWLKEIAERVIGLKPHEIMDFIQNVVRKEKRETSFRDERPWYDWNYAFLERNSQIVQIKNETPLESSRAKLTKESTDKWYTIIFQTVWHFASASRLKFSHDFQNKVIGSSKSMKFAYQKESQPIHWPIVFRVRLVCISSRFYKTRGQ